MNPCYVYWGEHYCSKQVDSVKDTCNLQLVNYHETFFGGSQAVVFVIQKFSTIQYSISMNIHTLYCMMTTVKGENFQGFWKFLQVVQENLCLVKHLALLSFHVH